MSIRYILKDKNLVFKVFLLSIVTIFLKYISHLDYKFIDLLGVYQLYLGGLFLDESSSIVYVLTYLIIIVSFILFVVFNIVKEMKENEIYFITRLSRKSTFFAMMLLKILFACILYQFICLVLVMIITKKFDPISELGIELFKLCFLSMMQTFIIASLSALCLYYYKFEIGVLLALFLVLFPIIITGVLYNENLNLNLCKYIFLNHGNYNYYKSVKYMIYEYELSYPIIPNLRFDFMVKNQLIEAFVINLLLYYAILKRQFIGGYYDD